MASASPIPRRGEIWSAHASAILPILQAAAACSLVGLSEAMLSDKTSLESADPSDLPLRPCLIIEGEVLSRTFDVVVFTTCGRGKRKITQMSAHSQFFAVSVGETRPWPYHDSPVVNVHPAWPKSFETPAYAIAYIVTIPRTALIGRWYENDELYTGARFFCDDDTVEELEALCDERRSIFSSMGAEERANWDRTYEVSRREWLLARQAETNLSTIASEVYAHRHAFTEQPHSAGRPAQDSGRREQRDAHPRPPPVTSRSHRPAPYPSPPSQMPTTATQHHNGLSNQPRLQEPTTRTSQACPRAPDPPRAEEFPPLRDPLNCHDTALHDSKDADTPDTTPTDSPSSLADSLSTSGSEASPGAGPACELRDDEPGSTAKDPPNNLLLSLDGDDAETVAGIISYSQIVKGVGVPRADPVPLNMDVAMAEPQQGKKAKRSSRVNIFSVSLRMGAGTRTTLF